MLIKLTIFPVACSSKIPVDWKNFNEAILDRKLQLTRNFLRRNDIDYLYQEENQGWKGSHLWLNVFYSI